MIKKLISGEYSIAGTYRLTSPTNEVGLFLSMEIDTQEKAACSHLVVPKDRDDVDSFRGELDDLYINSRNETEEFYSVGVLIPSAEEFTVMIDEAKTVWFGLENFINNYE
jgi:hypothetical protein